MKVDKYFDLLRVSTVDFILGGTVTHVSLLKHDSILSFFLLHFGPLRLNILLVVEVKILVLAIIIGHNSNLL